MTGGAGDRWPGPLRRLLPRTFQGRLTVAFVGVVALVLLLVSVLVLNRLDDYFTKQQQTDLIARNDTVSVYVQSVAATYAGQEPVVDADGTLNPAVVTVLSRESQQRFIADYLAKADVVIDFGLIVTDRDPPFVPSTNGPFVMPLGIPPPAGQTREADVLPRHPPGRPPVEPVRPASDAREPLHVPRDRHRQCRRRCWAGSRCWPSGSAVLVSAATGPPVHDPAAPADRGVARDGGRRPDAPRAQYRGPSRFDRDGRACRSPFNAMADRRPGEPRVHPARP